jgi:hypothetical protein
MIGAPYPQYQTLSTSTESLEPVPLHRRLFAPGKHQYTPLPQDKDYFSIPASEFDYQSKMALGNIRLRCDEANKLAAEEMQRREDEQKYGPRRRNEDHITLLDPSDYETSWWKVLWNAVYVAKVVAISVMFVIVVKHTMPVVLLVFLAWGGKIFHKRYLCGTDTTQKNAEFEDNMEAGERRFYKSSVDQEPPDTTVLGNIAHRRRPTHKPTPLSKARCFQEKLRLDGSGRAKKTRNNRARSRSLTSNGEKDLDGIQQATMSQSSLNENTAASPSSERE